MRVSGQWLGLRRQMCAAALSPFVSQTLVGTFVSSENSRDIHALRELIDAGVLTSAIDRVCPLAELPAAMRDLVDGRVAGKVVTTP